MLEFLIEIFGVLFSFTAFVAFSAITLDRVSKKDTRERIKDTAVMAVIFLACFILCVTLLFGYHGC